MAQAQTYLVTGGAGNLAKQLIRVLTGTERIILLDVAKQPTVGLDERCQCVQADLTCPRTIYSVFQQYRPTVVLHFASLLSGKCEDDRTLGWHVNMDVAFQLFEASLRAGVERFFFPSSLAAYGGELPDPLPEDNPQWPEGLYGVTKAAVERLGVYYRKRHGLDFRCIRLPVVVSRFAPSGAASAYVSRAFVETVQHGYFSFKVNTTTRVSTAYVKDVVRAIAMLIQAPREDLTRCVYNIHAMAPSAQEIADAIAERLSGVRLVFETDPAIANLIESWPAVIEDESSRQDWAWRPHFDLGEMADDFIQELRN